MKQFYVKTYEEFSKDKAVLIDGELIVYLDGKAYVVTIDQKGYCNYRLKEQVDSDVAVNCRDASDHEENRMKDLYYVVIGYSNPNLKTSKADIKVLCKVPGGVSYWENTDLNQRENWFKFRARESAERYISEAGLENCITYGIRY